MTNRLYLSPPEVTDEDQKSVLAALASGWVAPAGPELTAFERDIADYTGVSHAVALSSGTAALHLGLEGLGVGPGDTVVTSTLTFAATTNAIRYLGADPIFVDVDPDRWTICPDLLETLLSDLAGDGRLPRAVLTVDLYGQCADYDRIEDVTARHGIPILEDAAEALGAQYRGRAAGSFGRAAAFSFNGNKIITTSGGGMLVSNDEALVARARHLATQAREPVPHYEHREVGYNYRLSNVLAALGRSQLRDLDARVERRRSSRATYQDALGDEVGLRFMPDAENGRSNAWLTCVLIDPSSFRATSLDVLHHLERLNIEARPLWKPMHLQPAFREYRCVGGAVAEQLFACGLCLPSGSGLTDSDRRRVIAGVLSTPRRSKEPTA